MSENLKQYVYALMDPRDEVIFYIGKGTGPRANAHMIEASSLKIENRKVNRIREIKISGEKVRTLVLAKEYEKANEAYAVESLCIIQARRSGEVLGIKCDLTNIARGHHEGRFRLWSHPEELAGFEIEIPQASFLETYKQCQPLYDYIIQNVSEFKNPKRNTGQWINSQKRGNGFAFVVIPKKGEDIHFEYIGRKPKNAEQMKHAQKLRDITGYGGDSNSAKVDYPRHDLLIDQHEEVAKALEEFIDEIDRAEAQLLRSETNE